MAVRSTVANLILAPLSPPPPTSVPQSCPPGWSDVFNSGVCIPDSSIPTAYSPPGLSTGGAMGVGVVIGVVLTVITMMSIFLCLRKKRANKVNKNDVIVVTESGQPVEEKEDEPTIVEQYRRI
jgi:hypothetical protein